MVWWTRKVFWKLKCPGMDAGLIHASARPTTRHLTGARALYMYMCAAGMDFTYMPFDSHTCTIEFSDWKYTANEVRLHFPDGRSDFGGMNGPTTRVCATSEVAGGTIPRITLRPDPHPHGDQCPLPTDRVALWALHRDDRVGAHLCARCSTRGGRPRHLSGAAPRHHLRADAPPLLLHDLHRDANVRIARALSPALSHCGPRGHPYLAGSMRTGSGNIHWARPPASQLQCTGCTLTQHLAQHAGTGRHSYTPFLGYIHGCRL
jgi:hypothetical protein